MPRNHAPLISVLIPMYNAGAGISDTLRSVRAQTLDDYEVIVVDDGSSDDSAQRARMVMPDAQILTKEHGGLTEALNHGLATCRGKYIARMDCFDLAFPRRFALQVKAFDTSPDIGLVGGHVMLYDGEGDIGVSRYPIDPHEIERELIRGHSAVLHSTVMMRRDLLLRLGGYDPFYNGIEDFELLAKFSLLSKLSNVDEVVMRIFSHAQGLTYGGAHLRPLFDLALHERQQRLDKGLAWQAADLRSQYAARLLENKHSAPIDPRALTSRYFAMRGGLLLRSGERRAAIRDYFQSIKTQWTQARSWVGLAAALLIPKRIYRWALELYKSWDYRLALKKVAGFPRHG